MSMKQNALCSVVCVCALVSLACVASAVNVEQLDVMNDYSQALAVENLKESVSTAICARVTAETAVHLRVSADPESTIIRHLAHGDVVVVIDRDDSRWWRVERGGMSGYARSIYLEIVDCESEAEP